MWLRELDSFELLSTRSGLMQRTREQLRLGNNVNELSKVRQTDLSVLFLLSAHYSPWRHKVQEMRYSGMESCLCLRVS